MKKVPTKSNASIKIATHHVLWEKKSWVEWVRMKRTKGISLKNKKMRRERLEEEIWNMKSDSNKHSTRYILGSSVEWVTNLNCT
jgi:hypothetical protein